MNNHIWLIGAGPMAVEYARVLNELNVKYDVIGRGERSASSFFKSTGLKPEVGGVKKFLRRNPIVCSHAIIAVGVEQLANTTLQLLEYGVKNILVEKPAGLNKEEIQKVADLTRQKAANVFVAYNRRFYTSTKRAREIIDQDGGVTSFHFEFTEWAHEIEPLQKPAGLKEKWFLANSTHVLDLAFYLGGKPKEISTFTAGGLNWHPSASIFVGAGVSETGILFSYQANWESAGRWSVEILTKENRLIFRPMEKLKIMNRGSLQVNFVDGIDYTLDEKFKPGLFLQTFKFLNRNFKNMLDIYQCTSIMEVYYKIGNYI